MSTNSVKKAVSKIGIDSPNAGRGHLNRMYSILIEPEGNRFVIRLKDPTGAPRQTMRLSEKEVVRYTQSIARKFRVPKQNVIAIGLDDADE